MHDPEGRLTAGRARAQLSPWGRAGLALFALHVLLLFLPPIPPDVKGSLWSWLTGYGAVALLLVEVDRRAAALAAAWGGARAGRRAAWTVGVAASLFAVALAVRRWAPVLYARFEAEQGLWEPLTLLCYLAAASALYRSVGPSGGLVRRHRRFVATVFLLLGLEEIDYLGVFGAVFGRIHGVYAGSPHDLIRLAARGALGPAAWAAVGVASAALAAALWRTRYLQPRALAATIASGGFLWAAAWFAFVGAGAALDAELFGLRMARPDVEEVLELVGAVFLLGFGLSVAWGWRAAAPRPPSQRSDRSTVSTRSSASPSSCVGAP